MITVRHGEETPGSFTRAIFLTATDGKPWESEAIHRLHDLGFDDGVIFVGNEKPDDGYDGWQSKALAFSDSIVCFVPFDSAQPEFTTRSIVSTWAGIGKLCCGAAKGSWVDAVVAPHGITPVRSLDELMVKAFQMVEVGALRKDAEREVPLMVWRTAAWALWYENLVAAGNRLDGARLEWTFRVGPGKAYVLFWAVHANIWVQAEGRNKSNEVVIARPDIACVLAYLPGDQMLDTEIIVIKEFRSPCRNGETFVYELPGGSSFKPNADVLQTAADELFEECGIRVDKSRLREQGSRQAAATVTTHHVHLFSCEM